MGNNDYIFKPRRNIDFEEKLHVTNIYPFFTKLERNNGGPIKILNRNEFATYRDYFDTASIDIINHTVDLYDELAHDPLHHSRISNYYGFNIEYIISKDLRYKFILLRSCKDLIFLNYEKIDNTHDFFIPHEGIREAFVYNNKQYVLVNTYEAFLNFAHVNNHPISAELNELFFGSFKRICENNVPCANGIHHTCTDKHTKECFSFYTFENIVILCDYMKN